MEKLCLSNVVVTSVKLRSILLFEREIIKCLGHKLYHAHGVLIVPIQREALFIQKFCLKTGTAWQNCFHVD